MTPSIRKIRPEDLENVVSMLREFAEFEKLSEYCTATEERFHTAMFGDKAVVEGLLAFDGETTVGYALFYPNFSSFRAQQGMHLEDLYIDGNYRGCGIGEALLKEIAQIATSRGYERIDFFVLDWNTSALKFYKKLGAESNDAETHFKFSDEAFARLAS